MTVNAYAALDPSGELKSFTYEPATLGANDVEVSIQHCGICHSDLAMIGNEWGATPYPIVPGHEITGVVAQLGDNVSHLKPGDKVGIGWHSSACMSCIQCMEGDHNICPEAAPTMIGRHGGFADKIIVNGNFAIPLPKDMNAKTAGPLLCGGVTVYSPLVQFGIKPTARIGVVGIGGLGHLAIQFARAWGCEVVAFTSSPGKESEALELGATSVMNSRDEASFSHKNGTFDLIISTVNVDLNWAAYLSLLAPKGRLHFVGLTTTPLQLPPIIAMATKQVSVSASQTGSPATTSRMLEFAQRHGIEPITEHFRFDQVNEAVDRLRSGKARYRVVLSRD